MSVSDIENRDQRFLRPVAKECGQGYGGYDGRQNKEHPRKHELLRLRIDTGLRSPQDDQPEKLYGCEVWRNLDWLVDQDKSVFDLSQQENLQAALLGVFDSQISGGKRYDLASLARRRANATYFQSHGVDDAIGLSFAVDMTPLLKDSSKDPEEFIQEFIHRFSQDVSYRIEQMR